MRTQQYIDEILEYEEQLSEENREKFDEIFWRIRYIDIDEKEGAEFLYHCIDLFLEGERTGKSAEEMIGTSDLEKFCKEFIDESRKNYSFWKRLYFGYVSYIPLILLIYLGFFQMGNEWLKHCIEYGFDWNVRVNTGMIIETFLIVIAAKVLMSRTNVIYYIIESKSKKEKIKGWGLLYLYIVFFIMISIVLKKHMAVYMFSINYFFALGMLALICVVQNIWENK